MHFRGQLYLRGSLSHIYIEAGSVESKDFRPGTKTGLSSAPSDIQLTIAHTTHSESTPSVASHPLKSATEPQPRANGFNNGSNLVEDSTALEDNDEELNSDEDLMGPSSQEVSELFKAKGTAGHPSKELIESFDDTVSKIHSEINALAENMGCNPAAIRRSILGRLRESNSWTSYAKYFKANQEKELGCLSPGAASGYDRKFDFSCWIG